MNQTARSCAPLNLNIVLAELGRLVGCQLMMRSVTREGRSPICIVTPARGQDAGTPFWAAVRAATMRPDWPVHTPEVAVVAFAVHAKGWMAATPSDARQGLDAALRSRLAAGPVATSTLLAEFAANGISRDQLRRAAGKLGVTRTKASMKSGWLWSPPSHPSAASTEEGSALFEEPTRLHCERKPCDTPFDGAGST